MLQKEKRGFNISGILRVKRLELNMFTLGISALTSAEVSVFDSDVPGSNPEFN